MYTYSKYFISAGLGNTSMSPVGFLSLPQLMMGDVEKGELKLHALLAMIIPR